jgi:hypothetical protein
MQITENTTNTAAEHDLLPAAEAAALWQLVTTLKTTRARAGRALRRSRAAILGAFENALEDYFGNGPDVLPDDFRPEIFSEFMEKAAEQLGDDGHQNTNCAYNRLCGAFIEAYEEQIYEASEREGYGLDPEPADEYFMYNRPGLRDFRLYLFYALAGLDPDFKAEYEAYYGYDEGDE